MTVRHRNYSKDAVEPPADTPAPDAPVEGAGEDLQPTAGDPLEAALRAAVQDTLSGGPVARDTNCWNALQEAIPSIAKIINRHVLQEG